MYTYPEPENIGEEEIKIRKGRAGMKAQDICCNYTSVMLLFRVQASVIKVHGRF